MWTIDSYHEMRRFLRESCAPLANYLPENFATVQVPAHLLQSSDLAIRLGIVIGQRIRFQTAREMRRKLFDIVSSDVTVAELQRVEPQLKSVFGAKMFAKVFAPFLQLNDTCSKPGSWSANAFMLMKYMRDLQLGRHQHGSHTATPNLVAFMKQDKCLSRHLKKLNLSADQAIAMFGPYSKEVTWCLWRMV
jgi:hypothetical protein